MTIMPSSVSFLTLFLCFSLSLLSSAAGSKAVTPAIVVSLRRPVIPRQPGIPLEVTTTLTHVGDGPATYTAAVTPPRGCVVTVEPTELRFKEKGEEKSYVVVVYAREAGGEAEVAGKVTWPARDDVVTVPVVVKWE